MYVQTIVEMVTVLTLVQTIPTVLSVSVEKILTVLTEHVNPFVTYGNKPLDHGL